MKKIPLLLILSFILMSCWSNQDESLQAQDTTVEDITVLESSNVGGGGDDTQQNVSR